MKVALVQAPVWWTVDPPLGLAQIAGCVRHHGHEPAVFDLNMALWKERSKKYDSLWVWEQFHFWNQPDFVQAFFRDNAAAVDRHVEAILRTDAPVIGFSVYGGSQLATLELARRVKAGDRRRQVVLGGQYFFFGDKVPEMLGDPAVDAVVAGAGDSAFPALLARVAATGAVEPLPGVWVKRDGQPVSGGPALPVKDLDALPFADFTGFPMELYTDPARLPMAGSRGCVWQCRFCSARAFWEGYTYMGGDRIFAEVMHHKRTFPDRCHVEFYDITANGDVRALHRFARLAADAVKEPATFFGWKINAILRPEMTPEVLGDLRRANCHDIIYGVESGSPRVLKAMNKHYTIETAERVLKDTHDAGIVTTVNVMFGYPGEQEEDFQQTLDFVRRNRASLDRVYASATFTSLEAHSYLTEHSAEFGIKEVPPERFHNLYWETLDGKNTYPVRLDRYKRFRELSISMGIDAYKGVAGALEQDRLSNLAQYHHHSGSPLSALECHLYYLDLDLYHEPTRRHLILHEPHLRQMLLAVIALEKADRVSKDVADPATCYHRLRRLMEGPGGLRAAQEAAESPAERRLTTFLSRAILFLQRMEGQGTRIEWEGRFRAYWSQERAPDRPALALLLRRLRMMLALTEAEIRRGDDKRPEPVCAR